MSRRRLVLTVLCALAFVVAGSVHFVEDDFYMAMMPSWVPEPLWAHRFAGACEIAGGLGLLLERTRRAAAIGLCLLLVAVFPANVRAALYGMAIAEPPPAWALWVRLPFQAAFIYAVWWVGVKRHDAAAPPQHHP